MNDTQLYLSVGIPSVLVFISWVTTLVQKSKLNSKLDSKIEKLDSKIELLRSEFATETRAIRGDVKAM